MSTKKQTEQARMEELETLVAKLYMALKDVLPQLQKYEPRTAFPLAEEALKEVEESNK